MPTRPYTPSDLPALHAINVAGEPGVGAVTAAELGAIIEEGDCLISVNASDDPLGFLLTLGPEAGYASPNYEWFASRYESFVYVDRIAIAGEARGQGLGGMLYDAAFARFAGKALLMGCEVNVAPPNPGSMRFHRRLGFDEVGHQSFAEDKAVAYLARRLT